MQKYISTTSSFEIIEKSIAYSDQNFCDWDLKLLQATQHQGSHDRQFSGLPVVAALSC